MAPRFFPEVLEGGMLRTVELAGRPMVEPVAQAAPQLMWVKLADLVVDEAYQRPLARNNWASIERIAAHFRWSRFSPVLVAPIPGGRFAIVDGQHRAHAALMCGFDSVPAMVVPMEPAEQAGAFTWVNGQVTRVTPGQVFKAALAAGEAWAVDCREAVAAGGCTLMASHQKRVEDKKPGHLFCIGLVRKHVMGGTAWAVTAGLRAIRVYDGDKGRVALYSDHVLQPWINAIATDRAFAALDLVDVLRRRDPFLVIETANRIAAGEKAQAPAHLRVQAFVALLRQAQRGAA